MLEGFEWVTMNLDDEKEVSVMCRTMPFADCLPSKKRSTNFSTAITWKTMRHSSDSTTLSHS